MTALQSILMLILTVAMLVAVSYVILDIIRMIRTRTILRIVRNDDDTYSLEQFTDRGWVTLLVTVNIWEPIRLYRRFCKEYFPIF